MRRFFDARTMLDLSIGAVIAIAVVFNADLFTLVDAAIASGPPTPDCTDPF